jgi:RNA polymerase sigma factor (sigma-70 family)
MGDVADPPPELIQQLRDGDPRGADALFARYAQRLTRIAETHLSGNLAGRLDGSDIVQSVFRTFFRRSAEGHFQIDSTAQLWRLLVKITVLKVRAKGRYHTAGVRNVGAEASAEPEDWLVEATRREPGPLEAVMFIDQLDALLRGLPDLHCQVLDLRLQGFGPTEIAPRLGVSRQTVYRALALLQERLEEESQNVR